LGHSRRVLRWMIARNVGGSDTKKILEDRRKYFISLAIVSFPIPCKIVPSNSFDEEMIFDLTSENTTARIYSPILPLVFSC
jgi:hypothetical protein